MIYLLRHGQIEGADQKRFIGWTDPPLSYKGRQTARRLQKSLSGVVFEKILCSDLRRSRETAEIIAGDRPITAMPELREIRLGEWDGLPRRQIQTQQPDAWRQRGEDMTHFQPPGGESFADLSDRVLPVFNRIAQVYTSDNAHALIVGHAGVNRLILCHILDMKMQNMFLLGQDYGGLTLIGQRRDGLQVKAVNIPTILNQDGAVQKQPFSANFFCREIGPA